MRSRKAVFLLLPFLLVFALVRWLPEKTFPKREGLVSLVKSWGKFPLSFVENRGQSDPRIRYSVLGSDKTLFFGSSGLTISIHPSVQSKKGAVVGIQEAQAAVPRWNVKMDFVGANPKGRVEGGERSEAKFHYFKGSGEDWKTGVSTYRSIAYRELWPGVDLVYSGSVERLKQDFVVRPHSDPARIRLAYLGLESAVIAQDGAMALKTPFGDFRDERPEAYQVVDGKRRPVEVAYDLKRDGDRYEYGFRLGPYDRSRELVIDPLMVIYAGFLGGNAFDLGKAIAVDGSGNVYVTGETASTEADFPETAGPDLTQNGGSSDAFVAKVAADGSGLIYAGFLGGDGGDSASGIAVDGSGNAYVTGLTTSTETTFPETVGPDLTQNGGSDAFVAKVAADGSTLVYAGFLGGSGAEGANAIAVDAGGNAYIIGSTTSTETDFPETVGPDLTQNGDTDVFVAKIRADGSGLAYAGFLGGSLNDIGSGIAVDGNGNAYVAGSTASTEADFPETVGPDLTQNGSFDAFVAKVTPDGSGLVYAGYIGGSGSDTILGIALDGSGNAYVAGNTSSTETTFPVTVGPDLTQNGTFDAFVAKVTPDGSGLVYSGFIGGDISDGAVDIAVDASGSAYVTGFAGSTEATFPVTVGPDLTHNGANDAFVAKVTADGSSLAYSGFIGGGEADAARGIAVDASGNVYVIGEAGSTEATFPVTGGPDLTHNGDSDAFVAKVGIVPVCGDGAVEGDEECDEGGSNSDSVSDACRTDCTDASCGDGVQDSGEECDDNNITGGDGCSAACAEEAGTGGDGDGGCGLVY